MARKTQYLYERIARAREVLGLEEYATMSKVKDNYRELVKRHHPDGGAEDPGSSDKIRRINEAYRIIMDYIENYRYSFKEEDVKRNDPEYVMGRFTRDWH